MLLNWGDLLPVTEAKLCFIYKDMRQYSVIENTKISESTSHLR